MYTHRAFVTSVRASVFAPQIAASASLSFFGAKIPFFAAAFFSAVRVLRVAFVRVVRVFVVGAAVFVALVVVVVICDRRVEMNTRTHRCLLLRRPRLESR